MVYGSSILALYLFSISSRVTYLHLLYLEDVWWALHIGSAKKKREFEQFTLPYTIP